jgi:hypothetical protein
MTFQGKFTEMVCLNDVPRKIYRNGLSEQRSKENLQKWFV